MSTICAPLTPCQTLECDILKHLIGRILQNIVTQSILWNKCIKRQFVASIGRCDSDVQKCYFLHTVITDPAGLGFCNVIHNVLLAWITMSRWGCCFDILLLEFRWMVCHSPPWNRVSLPSHRSGACVRWISTNHEFLVFRWSWSSVTGSVERSRVLAGHCWTIVDRER